MGGGPEHGLACLTAMCSSPKRRDVDSPFQLHSKVVHSIYIYTHTHTHTRNGGGDSSVVRAPDS